ncbi:MAG: hypothetical protein ABL903_07460 [Methylococcales bacterium]
MQQNTCQNSPDKLDTINHSNSTYTTNFPSLPDDAIIRRWDIIGCKKRKIAPVWNVGNTTLNNRIKAGLFPKAVKLGGENTRCVGWRVGEIREFLANLGNAEAAE